MRLGTVGLTCCGMILLAACGTHPPRQVQPAARDMAADIPFARDARQDAAAAPPLPAGKAAPETYSVVVSSVPARDVLFALARDAKINLDIRAGIQGEVTLNAIGQTLPQILERMAKQVDMRYELAHGNLDIMPDTPFLKHYKIDYVNMARDSDGAMANAIYVGSATSGTVTGAGSAGGNNSLLGIRNVSRNHFWETLIQNIKDILHETDRILPAGSSETVVEQNSSASTSGIGMQTSAGKKRPTARPGNIENSPTPAVLEQGATTVMRTSTFREAAAVIANPESGIITVRATGKQHARIGEFIGQVMANARKQVLIEATVVEVRLSDQYQQGINWSQLRLGARGFQLRQEGSAGLPATNTGSLFLLDYANPASTRIGPLSLQISLLESFGKVKVLSSPKLSVINNQTAMLRVVDNLVYFTVKADTTTNQSNSVTTYTTTPNIVPIGFTMSVTPQIDDSDTVLLNLRPSISRLLGYVNDPNPSLAAAGVVSRIPQTQTREMESVLKIDNRQVAVLGGLMQDEVNNLTDAVPLLSRIPLLGNLFRNRNDTSTRTELVIFLRPSVIHDPGDSGMRREDYGATGPAPSLSPPGEAAAAAP
jgi:MSHA biogenesis protein MshL